MIIVLLVSCYVCFFFFFFQAEDGIRDATVTGVQTCALPILSSGMPRRRSASASCARVRGAAVSRRRQICRATASGPAEPALAPAAGARPPRSEERRVGKECRYRWWPYK